MKITEDVNTKRIRLKKKKLIESNNNSVTQKLKLSGCGVNVVNIRSILGLADTKISPAYVAAKDSLLGLANNAALDLIIKQKNKER